MNRALATSLIGITVLALSPSAVWAEVMDKEPTLAGFWSVAILLGLLGFFAWRQHVGLGVLAMAVAAFFVWSFYWELTDAHVGPAILQEAGAGYVVQAYGAMLVCAALHLAGTAALVRRQRRGDRAVA